MQLIQILNLMFMLFCPMLHFWPSKLAHMDLISSICLLCTCTHCHIKVVSPIWCIEHLITKTGRNDPVAHFPFKYKPLNQTWTLGFVDKMSPTCFCNRANSSYSLDIPNNVARLEASLTYDSTTTIR